MRILARLVDVARASLGDFLLGEVPFERHQEALGLRREGAVATGSAGTIDFMTS